MAALDQVCRGSTRAGSALKSLSLRTARSRIRSEEESTGIRWVSFTCRPGERRDPYRVISEVADVANSLLQQFPPVVMGPCFRRDDAYIKHQKPLTASSRPAAASPW